MAHPFIAIALDYSTLPLEKFNLVVGLPAKDGILDEEYQNQAPLLGEALGPNWGNPLGYHNIKTSMYSKRAIAEVAAKDTHELMLRLYSSISIIDWSKTDVAQLDL
jgi:hypothetical protein